LISAIFVFPALLVLRDRRRLLTAVAPEPAEPSGLVSSIFKRPGLVVGLSAAATVGTLFLIGRVRFDQNLLKLQAGDTEAVKFETKLLKDAGRSSWFAVSLARDRAEAEKRAAAFRKLPEVSESETIASFIPRHQQAKRAMLAELAPVVEAIVVGKLGSGGGDSGVLMRQLKALYFKLASANSEDPSSEVARTADLLKRAIEKLRSDPRAFSAYEARVAEGLRLKLAEFKRALAPATVTVKTLPAALRERFVGRSGSYLVQVYPRGDVWADEPLQRFVSSLRTVDPDVTGPPVQTYAIAQVMRSGYERAAVLALLAVFLLVFADFRNLRDTALASVPLLFGGVWLLELMGLVGWEFNLANLFAVPIIIGTAVDNGVNMLYRWREERDKSELILNKAVGKSVTVCSLTTIAGFAALIPASHRGISSLGWVLGVGVCLILIATLLVLPALFQLVGSGTTDATADRRPSEVKPARVAGSGISLLFVAIAVLGGCLFFADGAAAAGKRPPAHRPSRALVVQAETLIAEASRQNPVSTAKVHAAIEKLSRAIAIDAGNDAAYVDLGFCYGLLREGAMAADMYRAATEINPSAANFRELANIYLRIGEPEQALMAANAGLIKDSKSARLYNAKGMSLYDLRRFDEAAEAFRKALRYDPSLGVARANLRDVGGVHSSSDGPAAARVGKKKPR